MISKKNPWSFAYKWSGVAIILFITVFVIAHLTMPEPGGIRMGLENIVATALGTAISVVMIAVGLGVSVTRAVIPEKYLQTERKADPRVRKRNKLLALILIVIILAALWFVYFITTDFAGSKEQSEVIKGNFSIPAEFDINHMSGGQLH